MSEKKIKLVREVASEAGKLKRKIINALDESNPKSYEVSQAVSQLMADLNELVQSAPVSDNG
tara:strand:- start:1090 stop:1275 length:186 start_codon:yes stop_codon:yes gene_type:complete